MKRSFLLCLLMAFLASWVTVQAEELTVNDGTTTNAYVPIATNYGDYGTRSQFVVPAGDLEELANGTITAMTFYSQSASLSLTGTWEIYLKEVSEESASSTFISRDGATLVWTGSPSIANNVLNVEFSEAFAYGGGNLMIEFVETTMGSYQSSSWYGVSGTSVYINGTYNDHTSHITAASGSTASFVPKVTFEFTPGEAPACAKPTGLEVKELSTNLAKFTWTAGGEENKWQWACVAAGADVESWSDPVDAPEASVTDLVAESNYDFYVRAYCDDDNQSKASKLSIFTGYCTPNPTSRDGQGITLVTLGGVQQSSAAHPSSAPFYANNSNFSFEVPASSTAFVDITYATGYTYGTIIWVDWNNNLSFEANEVVYSGTSSNANPTTLNCSFAVPASQPVGTYRMRIAGADSQFDSAISSGDFSSINPCGTYTYTVFEDYSIKVTEAPACVQPEGLAVVPSTISAELSWTKGDASAWQLCVNGDEENLIDVTAMPYTLEGLTANTPYSVKLRTNCGEEVSAWGQTVDFRTECGIVTTFPWNYGFEDVTAGSGVLPSCWERINTYSSSYPYVYATYSHNGDNCLYFYAYGSYYSDQYAILPEMENVAGKQITFWAKYGSGASSIKVGTIEDPADVSTFHLITEITLSSYYAEYTVELTGGEGNYIALLMEAPTGYSSKYVYIDDITVENIPTCKKPSALDYSNVQNHSVQLSWTAPEGQNAWQICLNGDEENLVEADANPFVVTGLDAETAYTAKLRANCGNGDYSDWSNEVSFTTLVACPAPIFKSDSVKSVSAHSADIAWGRDAESYVVAHRTAAYVDGFEEHFDASSIPSGWTRYSGLVDGVVAGTVELSSGTSWATNSYALGTYNAKLNVYGTDCKHWLVTPEIAIKAGYTLSFDLALTDYGNADPIEDATAQADDRFVVLAYADGAWKVLREWNNSGSEYVYNNIPNTGNDISDIDISGYVGQNVKFAFYGESTVTSNGDNDIHIDNVQVGIAYAEGAWVEEVADDKSFHIANLEQNTKYDVTVQCNCGSLDGVSEASSVVSFTTISGNQTPTDLAYDETTLKSDGVTVSWSGVASNEWHESYDIFIGKSNELPADPTGEEGLRKDISETSYDFTGELTPETTYYVWVRDNCGADGYSEWSASISFTTLADCSVPASLSVSNEAAHTADIAWAIGNSAEYKVRYRTSALDNVLFAEDFEDGAMPEGWTTNGNGTWSISSGVNSTHPSTAGEGTYNAAIKHSTKGYVTKLITPEMDLTGSTSAKLSYMHVQQAWGNDIDVLRVYYRASSSDEWTLLDGQEFTAGIEDWTTESEIALPNISATYQLAFEMTDNWGYGVGVDSIVITGEPIAAGDWNEVEESITEMSFTLAGLDPQTKYDVQVKGICDAIETEWSESISFITTEACFAPTALAKSNVTAHTVDLAWESEASAWQICVNNDEDNLIDVTTNPYTLDGLLAETAYSVKVRTDCSEEGFSAWSSSVSFTTLASCFAPTAPNVDEETITTNSATIFWEDEHDQAGYIVAYGLAADFDIENAETYELINVTDTIVNLIELQPSSEYKFRVKGDCGLEGESKDWSYSKTFFTACDAEALPFVEDFESGINCWTLIDCASGTGVKTEAKYEGDYGFKFQYNTNPPQYLISPELIASEKDLAVEFYYKRSGSSYEESFKFGYSTTTKATDAFTWGDEVIVTNNNNFEKYVDTIRVAGVKFVAIQYTANDKLALFIDNFSVAEVPEYPTALDNTGIDTKAIKRLENGILVIELNGTKYNAQGMLIRK